MDGLKRVGAKGFYVCPECGSYKEPNPIVPRGNIATMSTSAVHDACGKWHPPGTQCKIGESMRITESQLRKIVREEILRESLTPGPITTMQDFKQLAPGDRITINGKPAVVIAYDSFNTALDYAWEGTSTKRHMDMRYAAAWEPGERPEQEVAFVGAGAPVASPRRSPSRRSFSQYD